MAEEFKMTDFKFLPVLAIKNLIAKKDIKKFSAVEIIL
jgi:hypothetical protein